MPRGRDYQRERLYRAEEEQPHPAEFHALPEVQAFVDKVTSSQTWFSLVSRTWRSSAPRHTHPFQRGAKAQVEVLDGRGRRRAGAIGRWAITMPVWSRSRLVILHELAHVANPPGCASHGREFASMMLTLVARFIGRESYLALRAGYRKHGVRFVGRDADHFARVRQASLAARNPEPRRAPKVIACACGADVALERFKNACPCGASYTWGGHLIRR